VAVSAIAGRTLTPAHVEPNDRRRRVTIDHAATAVRLKLPDFVEKVWGCAASGSLIHSV